MKNSKNILSENAILMSEEKLSEQKTIFRRECRLLSTKELTQKIRELYESCRYRENFVISLLKMKVAIKVAEDRGMHVDPGFYVL